MSDFTGSDGTASDSAQRSESVKQYSRQYEQLVDMYSALTQRSYELPYRWYYVVFKPFNDSYSKDPYVYEYPLGTCSDYIRSKSELSISTREIKAAKVHVNSLVVSRQDLTRLDGTNITKRGLKYKLHVSLLESRQHRQNTLEYILKESAIRPFILYTDHIANAPKGDAKGSNSNNISDDPDEPEPKFTKSLFNCKNNKLRITL